ncbi:hypothetical protein, partial [Bacillus halotolerans]|uniref:hypothetical protein n=1 Tax=Bacillus halotolerans TaxID=260554 RepID=UPI0038161DEA
MYAFLRLLLVHDDYNSTDNGKMNSLLPMLNRAFCPIKPELHLPSELSHHLDFCQYIKTRFRNRNCMFKM